MAESTLESAIALAERDGLRLHLRIRLVILGMLAVWAVWAYAPSRAYPGLAVLAAFALFGTAQYALGIRLGLFADIRGFTTLSESLGTESTMRLLGEFHDVVTAVVFEHRGTLEKYIGDTVMSTFGTPAAEPDDASRALRCARKLAIDTRRWSAERVARGDTSVEIGMGLHYGEAMVGSIGTEQRLDYVVIGDTVNVASRLERLTREFDVDIVVSDDLVRRVREETGSDATLDVLMPRGDVQVAGRQQPIRIWSADRAQLTAGASPRSTAVVLAR